MNELKQLSQEEVKKLFDFVKSKYVRFIDLQYELVDHLASSIEDIQNQNPSTTFDQALKESYARFPITGFTHFIDSKQKSLSRYWRNAMLRFVKEYFQLPKIILLLLLSLAIWTAFKIVPHPHVLIVIWILISISFILNFKRLIINRKDTEKYLFLQSYNSMTLSNMYCILFLPLQVLSYSDRAFMEISFSNTTTIVTAFILSLSLIVSHVTLNVIPDLLQEELKNKYGHLNIKLS